MKKRIFKFSAIGKMTTNNAKLLSLIGISFIVFIVTVAFYFVANYISEGINQERVVSGWEYGYAEVGAHPDKDTMRIFSKQNPIITDGSVRRESLYLAKSVEAHEEEQTLEIMTDYSPMRILVNGREVYNNRYGEADFVGNCYNAITLQATERDQVVEVYMTLPFSVRFEPYVEVGVSNSAFKLKPALVIGAAMTLLGLIAAVVFFIIGKKKDEKLWAPHTSLVVACAGAAILFLRIPEATYYLNDPIWMRIFAAGSFFALFAAQTVIYRWLSNRSHAILLILFAVMVSAAAFMFAPTAVFRGASLLSAAAAVACAVILARSIAEYVRTRTQYSEPAFVAVSYSVMAIVLAGALHAARSFGLYLFTVVISTLVITGILEYVAGLRYFADKNNKTLREQTQVYGDSVDNVSLFIRDILACESLSDFYTAATDGMLGLLKEYSSDNADARCCVAAKENGEYVVKVDRGVGGCRFGLIEQNGEKNGKNCIFSETYFDYILRTDGKVKAIMHFENIRGGLSIFFISMIETAYCGIETAFGNVNSDGKDSKDVIFTELAENAEIANGYSPSHLSNIATYSRILCLEYGMSESEAEDISHASRLHDLGKIAIPAEIINKHGRLTEEEKIIVASHTRSGNLILSAYAGDPLLRLAADIARCHHEHFDGTGYNGLKGDDIPLAARIVSVCDVFDALTTERSYKKAWTVESSVKYMNENSGTLFDPVVIAAFNRSLPKIEAIIAEKSGRDRANAD